MCNCNNLEPFKMELTLPVKVSARVSIDNFDNIEIVSQNFPNKQELEQLLLLATKEELIKQAVVKELKEQVHRPRGQFYPRNLELIKFDTFDNGVFAHFWSHAFGFMYFYGYFTKLPREDCGNDCKNPIPKFIISSVESDRHGVEAPEGIGSTFHPAKCGWWNDWHSCSCE
jgi:hypothetical protein